MSVENHWVMIYRLILKYRREKPDLVSYTSSAKVVPEIEYRPLK